MNLRTVFSTLMLLAAVSWADDPPYLVEVEAHAIGVDQIDVAVEIRATDTAEGEPLSSPRILFLDGQRASIVVDSSAEGGLRIDIDVIKALGSAEVLVVTTISDRDSILWAEARTVPLQAAEPGDQ